MLWGKFFQMLSTSQWFSIYSSTYSTYVIYYMHWIYIKEWTGVVKIVLEILKSDIENIAWQQNHIWSSHFGSVVVTRSGLAKCKWPLLDGRKENPLHSSSDYLDHYSLVPDSSHLLCVFSETHGWVVGKLLKSPYLNHPIQKQEHMSGGNLLQSCCICLLVCQFIPRCSMGLQLNNH